MTDDPLNEVVLCVQTAPGQYRIATEAEVLRAAATQMAARVMEGQHPIPVEFLGNKPAEDLLEAITNIPDEDLDEADQAEAEVAHVEHLQEILKQIPVSHTLTALLLESEEGAASCILNIRDTDQPGMWGARLAVIVRGVGAAYARRRGANTTNVQNGVVRCLLAEVGRQEAAGDA